LHLFARHPAIRAGPSLLSSWPNKDPCRQLSASAPAQTVWDRRLLIVSRSRRYGKVAHLTKTLIKTLEQVQVLGDGRKSNNTRSRVPCSSVNFHRGPIERLASRPALQPVPFNWSHGNLRSDG